MSASICSIKACCRRGVLRAAWMAAAKGRTVSRLPLKLRRPKLHLMVGRGPLHEEPDQVVSDPMNSGFFLD